MNGPSTSFRGSVLVGYDGSTTAQTAVSWAAREAYDSGRPLLLVRCYEPPLGFAGVTWTPVGLPRDIPREQYCRRTTGELAERCRRDHPGLTVWTQVLDGKPDYVLGALAQEIDAGLTVVGCAEHGPLARLLLGSTSTELLQDCTRPVVVVHQSDAHGGESGPVLLDLADADDGQVIEFAFDHAARHRCPVHAVHAGHHRSATALDTKALDLACARHPEVAVRTEVLSGDPGHALVDMSAHARLLVVGNDHHTGAHRLPHRSLRNAALFHAACPVAVVTTGPDRAVA